MPHLVVCPLSKLAETVAQSGARHVISLINSNMHVPYPLSVPHDQRLFLGFNDITIPTPGLEPPEKTHAQMVIDFARKWDRITPLLVHCWMGISRSTAGAYIIQCALMPERDEDELAQALRDASPQATPNIRLVQFADDLLGRNGRMIEAILDIGRGEDAFEGTPFSLPLSV